MDSTVTSWITLLVGAGVIAGLSLLVRGLTEYRATVRVGDTSTSTISSVAAGEVRISGVVEAAEMTLVSLLQRAPCVYYESTIGNGGEVATTDSDTTEERSIGFRVRDATGSIRVFPRGARVDAPVRFSEETGVMGDEPAGLASRFGAATQLSEPDRATAIAELLRVHNPEASDRPAAPGDGDRRRRYREARLEVGDAVTIVGRTLPLSDLADPVAIPVIDPAANRLPLATPEEAEKAERTFDIAPDTLVLASSVEVPLLIAHGTPGAVMERSQSRYTLGLLGAVLAIASAMVFAIMINGGFGL